MKLTDEEKKIIKECATNISNIIYDEVDEATVMAIEAQVAQLVKAANDYVGKDDYTTVPSGFNDFYKVYFTEALTYAVKNNNAKEYGKLLEKEMNKIFNAMPDEYKNLCKGSNPLEIEGYEDSVKIAFAEKISVYYAEKFESDEIDPLKRELIELKGATDKCVSNLTDNNDEKNQIAFHALVGMKYDAVVDRYESLGFFKKYFWFTGYKLRSAMKYTEKKMSELNKSKEFTTDPMDKYLVRKGISARCQLDNALQSVKFFNELKSIQINYLELKTGEIEGLNTFEKVSVDLNEKESITNINKDEPANDEVVASL